MNGEFGALAGGNAGGLTCAGSIFRRLPTTTSYGWKGRRGATDRCRRIADDGRIAVNNLYFVARLAVWHQRAGARRDELASARWSAKWSSQKPARTSRQALRPKTLGDTRERCSKPSTAEKGCVRFTGRIQSLVRSPPLMSAKRWRDRRRPARQRPEAGERFLRM